MLLTDEIFKSIRLGQEICIVNAPGQLPVPGQCERHGAVVDKVKNARSQFLIVLFDDGHKEYVGDLTDHGEGAYLYPELKQSFCEWAKCKSN